MSDATKNAMMEAIRAHMYSEYVEEGGSSDPAMGDGTATGGDQFLGDIAVAIVVEAPAIDGAGKAQIYTDVFHSELSTSQVFGFPRFLEHRLMENLARHEGDER